MEKNEKTYPMVLVFYLDADLMKTKDIMQPFAESVNNILAHKNSNAIAFFIPTKGEERIECINPLLVAEADMEKINKMVEDIKEKFSIGIDMEIADEEITLDDNDCDCNGGECNCDK